MRGPKPDLELVERIKPLAEQELTAAEIGELIGKTKDAVIGLARRNHIELKGNKEEKKSRAMRTNKAKRDGVSVEKIATRSPTPYYPKVTCNYRGKPKATCCWSGCSNEPVATGKPYCNLHKQ